MVVPAKPTTWTRRSTIWIADCNPADYFRAKSECDTGQLAVRFMTSARDVLRSWPSVLPDVLLISVQLRGIGGLDLVEMLRPFPEGVTIGMVGDRYVMEDEIGALSLGVHHYLCKPLDGAVLSELCLQRKPITLNLAQRILANEEL